MKWVVKDNPKLYRETDLSSFLEISPRDPAAARCSGGQLEGREYPREALTKLLLDYNEAIGNDSIACEKIATLRKEGSCCVITGQQLGFMGGPSYTILKAISCLLVARQYNAVPIFWLATEDHDLDEIDHAYLLDPLGNLNKFHLSLPKDGRFVEDLQLFPQHFEIIGKFQEAVGLTPEPCEASYARTMIRFMLRLFEGTGLVFVEPCLLRPQARDFFKRELTDCDEISRILQKTTRELMQAGGKATLDVTFGSNLFIKMEGKYRCKIERQGQGFHAGHTDFSQTELLNLVDREPERFSTNAAARTVLQSALFPTLAYVAGPGELSYYHQLKDYHHFHNVPMPWILPRVSASLVTPEAQDILHKCQLEPWDEIPHHWPEVVPHLETGLEGLQQEWAQSCVKYFSEDLSEDVLSRFVRDAARKLQRKVVVARLRQKGISPHGLHYLRNLLHPHERLQERVINWWEFQSQSQENLVEAFLKGVDWETEGHVYGYI